MEYNGLPEKQGLYDPQFEHDACGIGFIANIKGDYFTPVWMIIGFILVLGFKNSMEKMVEFKPNYKIVYLIVCLVYLSFLTF